MRSYCTLFIDAGYLAAAASTRVTGTSLRSATQMDTAGLLADLTAQVEADSGLSLLRIHWYDSGTRAGFPSTDQQGIAKLPRVKVRLGRVGYNGEQKGVDLKLALDLIAQSRNRAAEVVYLVSGDDDLSEAVEEAQVLGVQVVALVVPDTAGEAIAFSHHLHQTVDRLMLIDEAALDARVRKSPASGMHEVAAATRGADLTVSAPAPAPAPESPVAASPVPEAPAAPAPVATTETIQSVPAARRAEPATPTPLALPRSRPIPAPAATRSVPAYVTSTGYGGRFLGGALDDEDMTEAINDVVEAVVHAWWRSATPAARHDLMRGLPNIPGEIDRTLLSDLSNKVGIYDLQPSARFALRAAFWQRIERL